MARTRDIGMGYAGFALFFNVGMDVLAKIATEGATTWQIVFFRWFFGLLLLSVPFFMLPSTSPKSPFKLIHCIRLCLNLVASFCLYHALGALPLSVVLTIFFLEPMITIFAAAVLLREQVSGLRWAAGVAGFIGVAIIARPDIGADVAMPSLFDADVLVAVLGASCWAVMRVLTKKYGASISVITLSFWLAAFTTVASTPMMLASWQPLEPRIYALLFGVAGFGVVYNYMWLKALMVIPVARTANLSYMALPFSLVVGVLFFQEIPTTNFYLGSAIILCVLLVTANKPVEQALQNMIKNMSLPKAGPR